MITDKDAPSEIINIRQVWLKSVNRIAEAIAYRFNRDVNDQYTEHSGGQTVVESVMALYYLLVDYGEAPIKTEVKEWYDKKLASKQENINSYYNQMKFHQRWFEYMVLTLNKYDMLFESQPKGYTNVEMMSVE